MMGTETTALPVAFYRIGPTHPAGAKLSLNPVAVGQGRSQPVKVSSHPTTL